MTDSTVLDIPDGVYKDVQGWSGMIRHPDIMSIIAGAYPVNPPSKWFVNPVLANLTPLTIDDSGRVFGHIAAWHTSHIGMAGGVKPPRSKTNYAYYQTGVLKCDDSKFVDVGQITLTGGHAPLNAGVSQAVAHYDNTASAIMDVSAGEDKHGIWVAGALRPDVTEEQLRSIRASSVSGDWRPINGKLELVAICAVNAPGFPIPRARVASGAPIAIVAAGIEPLIEIAMNDRIEANVEEGIIAGLELFRKRMLRLENVVIAGGGVLYEEDPDTTTEESDTDNSEHMSEHMLSLRKRVRGGSAVAASLRGRVRGPQAPSVVEDVKALAASLRERVKGDDAGPKELAPRALTAAPGPWNSLLHPRGADGRFIQVGSWVRWLRQGFGSTRRGRVTEIVPDKDSKTSDGVITRVLAKVEFPDRDGKTVTYDVSFDELEKVAPPKGSIEGIDAPGDSDSDSKGTTRKVTDTIARKIAAQTIGHLIRDDEHQVYGVDGVSGTEDGNDTLNKLDKLEQNQVEKAIENAVETAISESVPDTLNESLNPTNLQLAAEDIANLDNKAADGGVKIGYVETPYVPPSDEWEKTSAWFLGVQDVDSSLSAPYVDMLRPADFSTTTEWADAVRLARSYYESWRTSQLAGNPEANVSLEEYLTWLKSRGSNDQSVSSADAPRIASMSSDDKVKQLRGRVYKS